MDADDTVGDVSEAAEHEALLGAPDTVACLGTNEGRLASNCLRVVSVLPASDGVGSALRGEFISGVLRRGEAYKTDSSRCGSFWCKEVRDLVTISN